MASGVGKRAALGALLGGSGEQSLRAARLRTLAPRYLAIAALVVLVALGVRSLLSPPSTAISRPRGGADAPSEDFALQFARAYLSYNAADPGARERALGAFLPQGLSAGAGFTPAAGSQRVLWAEVASDQAALIGGRVITVAAEVSTQSSPVYLAVTVRHPAGQALSLGGYPSFVGAPSVSAGAAAVAGEEVSDPALLEVVKRVIRNYLARSAADLQADLAPEAVVTLPTVALAVQSVDQVAWVGAPSSGAVLVTVTAADSRGDTYTLAYELGIAYRERPYVDFIEDIPTGS